MESSGEGTNAADSKTRSPGDGTHLGAPSGGVVPAVGAANAPVPPREGTSLAGGADSPAAGNTPAGGADLPAAGNTPAGGQPTKRLASLDVFRGLTIVGMLVVNNLALGALTPAQLRHAAWNQGVTFADMVFPWFLLIVGVAIPFAMESHRRKRLPAWTYVAKVLRRTLLLVALGCLIDSSMLRRPVFCLGVLQIIGLAYCVGALLAGLPVAARLLVAGVLLGAHWAALRFLPVPGVGVGVLEEGRTLVDYLNQAYLRQFHLDGLVSVVPTAALVLIGSVFGRVLSRDDRSSTKALCLLLGGLALANAGWAWGLILPFSKPLWTASYVLYAGGWGCLVMGALYLIVDVAGWRAWSYPLTIFGTNAIVAYVAPILVKLHILQEWGLTLADGSRLSLQQMLLQGATSVAGRVGGGILYTAGYILFWWLVLLCLHHKRLFLRV